MQELSYITWNIDPRIFPSIELFRWYGFLWAVGIVLSYLIALHMYHKEKLTTKELDTLSMYVIFGIIIGARLGHVLFYDFDYYWQNPIEILPIKLKPSFQFTGLAGLASHGGIIGGMAGLYLYTRKYKRPYLWTLDRLVISGSLLGCFIRLGNLINSEIIGVPSTVPWAFIFTSIDDSPRHPAQLYESIFYLLTAIILFGLWHLYRSKMRTGTLFGLGLILIFTQRFLVEFLKMDQVAFESDMTLNMGQILSIPMILAGVAIILLRNKVRQKS